MKQLYNTADKLDIPRCIADCASTPWGAFTFLTATASSHACNCATATPPVNITADGACHHHFHCFEQSELRDASGIKHPFFRRQLSTRSMTKQHPHAMTAQQNALYFAKAGVVGMALRHFPTANLTMKQLYNTTDKIDIPRCIDDCDKSNQDHSFAFFTATASSLVCNCGSSVQLVNATIGIGCHHRKFGEFAAPVLMPDETGIDARCADATYLFPPTKVLQFNGSVGMGSCRAVCYKDPSCIMINYFRVTDECHLLSYNTSRPYDVDPEDGIVVWSSPTYAQDPPALMLGPYSANTSSLDAALQSMRDGLKAKAAANKNQASVASPKLGLFLVILLVVQMVLMG
ncbi:hypothetical protein H9P43_003366 [Blastocladiella emersonii ATCC 22665]|nr:hypothetical protein H9P43_003366 [Blastocladiella emersonii ATCC 22665]